MSKLNITNLEKLRVSEIGRIDRVRRDHRNEGLINPDNHFELKSYTVTLGVTNNLEQAQQWYKNCSCNQKTLWHIIGGKKCLLNHRQ